MSDKNRADRKAKANQPSRPGSAEAWSNSKQLALECESTTIQTPQGPDLCHVLRAVKTSGAGAITV
jgi:hypothetical protein